MKGWMRSGGWGPQALTDTAGQQWDKCVEWALDHDAKQALTTAGRRAIVAIQKLAVTDPQSLSRRELQAMGKHIHGTCWKIDHADSAITWARKASFFADVMASCSWA